MEDHNSNPADELRERFRSELGLPPAQRYYSEDELIDIFDNSGDAGDDYLRTEALLLGARLYPDSQALLERRAIFTADSPTIPSTISLTTTPRSTDRCGKSCD